MICALLAVLELVRLGAVLLVQGELFSSIRIRKHKMFDAVFANGGPIESGPSESGPAEGAAYASWRSRSRQRCRERGAGCD